MKDYLFVSTSVCAHVILAQHSAALPVTLDYGTTITLSHSDIMWL